MFDGSSKVCVIGAGTMGSGIAAHLANIGMDVTLLDLTAQSARDAFEKAKQARPPHFYVPSTAEKVRLGSLEENSEWITEADWICEAIVEKLDAKKRLFHDLEGLMKKGAVVTTNTSGLQISLLSEGRSEQFKWGFMGTHFFNPPRYLKLLELIPTEHTSKEAVAGMTRFLEDSVARRVVPAKDTPGFIANRFGMWSMYYAVHTAEKLGLSVEEVDAITGPFIGRPRSASFRLNDLVGIDIMEDIAHNLMERCPEDPMVKSLAAPRSLAHLVEKGWLGDKSGQGYYRREGKEFFALDMTTLAYRMRQDVNFPSLSELGRLPLAERLSQGIDLRDEVGHYLRDYLLPTLRYANTIKEEISHSVEDFDRVMKWGFGWEAGPFEMIDMIGAERVGIESKPFYCDGKMLGFSGSYVERKHEPQYAQITDFPVISSHEGFNVRDMGDGVHAVSTTVKMGVFSPALIHALCDYLESGKSQHIVLTSEARVFSAGFDLKFILDCIAAEDLGPVDEELRHFQRLGDLLRQTRSCAAVFGTCLGGGFEMAASCSLIAAAPETQIGLPESRVGVLPSGGGNAIMHLRSQHNAKALAEATTLLVTGTVAANADEARKKGFLRESDVTVYHPDRLMTTAKALALQAEPTGEQQWINVAGPVLGMVDRAVEELCKSGELTQHDCLIGEKIKSAMVKSTSREDSLERERKAFLELLKEGLSRTRMKHMVENGKPLRN